MIIRERDYLKNKKKKYLRGTLIWLFIMLTIFLVGYALNKSRNNMFTVVAAVLVLPVAQYATQLLAIWKFKDPDIEISKRLELIQGNYNLFHSVMIPDKRCIIHFDHIIVTGQKIYCIIDKHSNITNIKDLFNKKIKAKGIPLKEVMYIELSKIKDIDKCLEKIEINAALDNKEDLKEYTQLIAQMMM